MTPPIERAAGPDFRSKVWTTVAITALVVILILLIKASFGILLLILAGVLIALYFHGLGNLLHRKTGMSSRLSLWISILGSFILLGLFFWFTGARISDQFNQLGETIPDALDKLKEEIRIVPGAGQLLDDGPSQEQMAKVSSFAASFFKTTFGVLGDIYVVIFLGIFFTASPSVYASGIVRLVPPKGRPRAKEVITELGSSLTQWLKGQLLSMLVVAVFTGIGLVIMGVPMALALALIAGLLCFVPNFGPVLALIPAILVGLTVSPNTALMIAGLYILIQVVESNLITPQIQQKLINTPPAMIIISQLIIGTLIGGWGLLLAVPLMVIIMVLVNELYVKKVEGELDN